MRMRALALVARLHKVALDERSPAELVITAALAARRPSRIFFIAPRVELVHAISPAALAAAAAAVRSPVASAASRRSSAPFADRAQTQASVERASSLQIWTEALVTIAYLLRDSVICTCAAWLVNYLYAQGNLVSGLSPAAQSYAVFAVTSQFYTGLFIGFAAVVAQAVSFLSLHFIQAPTMRSRLSSCLHRVLRRCIWSAGLSMVGLTLSSYALSMKSLVIVHTFKLQNYICGMFVFNFIISVDLAGRQLYQLETVEGQMRGYLNCQTYFQRWKLLVLKKKAALLAFCLILVYVHLTTLVDFSGFNSLAFAAGCILLKLVAQETFKLYVLRRRKSSLKTMYILVAAPTVIIGTQLRIALLRSLGITSSLSVIQPVALAVVELVVCLVKILLVHVHIQSRLSKIRAQVASETAAQQAFSDAEGSGAERQRRSSEAMRMVGESRRGVERTGALIEFMQWRARLLRFHGAEAHADMYVEYIAIGCSTSIFFFHCHPKYGSVFVAQGGDSAASCVSMATASSAMLLLKTQSSLLLQIGLEVIVDLVCSLAELVQGISFKEARRMSVFVSGLFVFFSILSIGVSASFSSSRPNHELAHPKLEESPFIHYFVHSVAWAVSY